MCVYVMTAFLLQEDISRNETLVMTKGSSTDRRHATLDWPRRMAAAEAGRRWAASEATLASS